MTSTSVAKTNILPLNHIQRRYLIVGSLLIGDALSICVTFFLAYQIRFKILPYPAAYSFNYYALLLSCSVPLWLALFWAYRLYSPKVLFGGAEEYARVFNAVTTGSVALVFLDFFINRAEEVSRGWLLLFWFLALVLIGVFRFSLRRGVYLLRRRGHLLSPAVIVNADEEGLALLEQLKHWYQSGLRVIGFLDNNLPRGHLVQDEIRVIGNLDDLDELVSSEKIEEVIVATGALTREQLLNLYRAVSWKPDVKLRFSSGLFEIISTGLHIKEMANVPLIEVNKIRITGMNALLKSLVDYVGAILVLILLSPIYLIISILIRLDSPGPIFYKHRVLGVNGEQFDAIKFRTMHQNSHEILKADPELENKFNQNFKLLDDPRVTRIGRILRRASLDELPQFVNVLLGQMSIVGPRFISPPEMSKFGKWGMNLLTVKPGITGLWQISGRSDVSYDERVRLDMFYIRNWTIWLDAYILLATIPAALSQKGAY